MRSFRKKQNRPARGSRLFRRILAGCLIALGICAIGLLAGMLSEWSSAEHAGAPSVSSEGPGSSHPAASQQPGGTSAGTEGGGSLEAVFLDVGEGDAALLICGDHAVMIDGGGRETSSFVVAYLKERGVASLDYLILTHFDEDHVAGGIGVLNALEVGCVLEAGYESDTAICRSLKRAEEKTGVPVAVANKGDRFFFGEAEIRILAPERYDHEIENDNSICLMVEYGQDRILFAGDTEAAGEAEILDDTGQSGETGTLRAQILKVGHHGSRTSTGEAFLSAVDPEFAVISCGAGNRYGHPSKSVLRRLEAHGTKVFRTDELGTVCFRTEGAGFRQTENEGSSRTGGDGGNRADGAGI